MAAKDNPFYIEPAAIDTNMVLSGIGSILKENRQKKAKQQFQTDFRAAYEDENPDAMLNFAMNNPEASKSVMSMLNFKNEGTRKNLADSMIGIDGDPNRFAEIMNARNDYLISQGADPKDTQEAMTRFAENPEREIAAVKKLMPMILNKQEWEAYKSQGNVDPEFLKEERKTASQDVRAFNRQAKEMRSSYGKLKSLTEQARGGSRGAKNAMVVSLARLISPGIVTENEAAALSGGQNTMQAVISGLTGKGIDTEAMLRKIDPYGDSFDADGLLKVGESVVASSRQPLIDMYEGSRDRAERSGMNNKAFTTNFGANKNYDFLAGFDTSSDEGSVDLNSMSDEELKNIAGQQ